MALQQVVFTLQVTVLSASSLTRLFLPKCNCKYYMHDRVLKINYPVTVVCSLGTVQ